MNNGCEMLMLNNFIQSNLKITIDNLQLSMYYISLTSPKQSKTKHIAIKYHYVRELVQDKEVKMEYVNTKEKTIDIFTKALPKDSHEYLRGKIGVISLSKAM